jgi:DNA-binding transcriptional LysR family regulator
MRAAATALHLTPSAVSQQLAALGSELRTPLVRPRGRNVVLTPEALVVLAHAEEMFAQWERTQAALEALTAGTAGPLRVGAFPSAISKLVAPAVLAMLNGNPEIEIMVLEADAPESFSLLAANKLDFVISPMLHGVPAHTDNRFYSEHLLHDPLFAVLPENSSIVGEELSLASLKNEQWITGTPGSACHQITTAACASAGFQPAVRHATNDWPAVLALVAAGAGVALIPRLALMQTRGVSVRRLRGDPPHRRQLQLWCRSGTETRPALQLFREHLRIIGQNLEPSSPASPTIASRGAA